MKIIEFIFVKNEKDGFKSKNKLGYKYSWVICGMDTDDDFWDRDYIYTVLKM